MNPLREIHRLFLAERFLRNPLSVVIHERTAAAPLSNPDVLDLVTIAFNTPWVIHEQIGRLKKYLTDPFIYTVVDNSCDERASVTIRQCCRNADVGYIRLRSNPYSQPSENHGLALTWAFSNFVNSRKARYFGFLDHDVFPVKETTLIGLISRAGVFGHQQERKTIWYLWPGFCFFQRDVIKQARLDFRPARGLDTGGRLWLSLYRNLARNTIPLTEHRYVKVGASDDPQSDLVEYIGDWIHVINASNWKRTGDKAQLVGQLLDGIAQVNE